MGVRSLLAVGAFDRNQRAAFVSAAEEAAFQATFATTAREATQWLETNDAHSIILRETAEEAESFALEARAQARHAQVPILSLMEVIDDLSFADVFSWGGDDAVCSQLSRALITRLRGLPREVPAAPNNPRGIALICDGDRARRIVLARVLRTAGYSIEFAVSAEDVARRAADSASCLVVANADLSAEPAALLRSARESGSEALWIVTCAPRELTVHRAAVEALGDATVTDGFAPPENIVFLANELERDGAFDKRSSRRLLYGTTVEFRGAGREIDDFGYVYNISLGGLYVRTLAAPEDDTVWLELQPPRSDRRVRLEGRVVWRRRFGPSGSATVPPGFGVQITDGSKADRDEWARAYKSFAAALGYGSIAA